MVQVREKGELQTAASPAQAMECRTCSVATFGNGRMSPAISASGSSDLNPTKIILPARVLIRDDALSFIHSHAELVCAAKTPSVQDVGIVPALVAAIDNVHRLAKPRRDSRLKLRLAFIELQYAIGAFKVTATSHLLRGLRRKRGYSNASLALDVYLQAKKSDPGDVPTRQTLSEYRRLSSRWSELAGGSPLQACIYADKAETIISNNSIRIASLQALAQEVRNNCPELALAWANANAVRSAACSEADINEIRGVLEKLGGIPPDGQHQRDAENMGGTLV